MAIVVQSYTTPKHGILLPYPSHGVYERMQEVFATQLVLQAKNLALLGPSICCDAILSHTCHGCNIPKRKKKKILTMEVSWKLATEAEMPRPSLWNVCPKLFCKLPLANGLYCLAGPKSKILEYHLPPSTQPGEAALRKIRALLKRKGSKCESLQ